MNIDTETYVKIGFTPETLVQVRGSLQPIKSLAGKEVEFWDGYAWAQGKVVQSSEQEEVVALYFSNGSHVCCTEETPWTLVNAQGEEYGATTRTLVAGDVLLGFYVPNSNDQVKLAVNMKVRQRRVSPIYTIEGLNSVLLDGILVQLN